MIYHKKANPILDISCLNFGQKFRRPPGNRDCPAGNRDWVRAWISISGSAVSILGRAVLTFQQVGLDFKQRGFDIQQVGKMLVQSKWSELGRLSLDILPKLSKISNQGQNHAQGDYLKKHLKWSDTL